LASNPIIPTVSDPEFYRLISDTSVSLRDVTMTQESELARKAAELRKSMPISDGGHIITGAQSIFEAPRAGVARFDLNENLFGASPKTIEAIKNFTERVGVQWYNAWMRKECEAAIAKYSGVKPSQVFVGNGSAETMVLIAQIFLKAGDDLVTMYPTYRVLPNYAKVYGVNLIEVLHESNFSGDTMPGRLGEKISAKTKMIYLCNPSTFSAKVPKTEIVKLLEKTRKPPHPIVIVDEAYYDCATYPFSNETMADRVKDYDNLIVVRTFSKGFALAGLRIGYALCSEHIVEQMNKMFSPLGVSSLAYVGAMAALEDLSYYEDVRKTLEENKKYLTEELGKLGLEVYPSFANFMLARFRPGILNDSGSRKGIWTRLVEKGIYLRNKSVMYAGTDICHDMIRITIGKREDCERFIKELREMMAAL
jgi:histidinol-phosphate aminotransferase